MKLADDFLHLAAGTAAHVAQRKRVRCPLRLLSAIAACALGK
jgi:hypothetical protein